MKTGRIGLSSTALRYIAMIFMLLDHMWATLISGSVIFPFHQNVMFTLLLGLLVIERVDFIKKNRAPKSICKNGLLILGLCILSVITFVDYNITGVLTVVLFYILRRVPFAPFWQLVGMVLINIVLRKGMYIPITIGSVTFEFITQGFAVFSLLLIWLYNGKKGCSKKWVQYFAYVFYPLHMLVLYMIWLLL